MVRDRSISRGIEIWVYQIWGRRCKYTDISSQQCQLFPYLYFVEECFPIYLQVQTTISYKVKGHFCVKGQSFENLDNWQEESVIQDPEDLDAYS
ncbi:hypothetical protein MKW98_013720, partial [Papaver atlanticum]